MGAPLVSLLWSRIDQVLEDKKVDRKWLKNKLKEEGANHRNKNTLSRWFPNGRRNRQPLGPTTFDQISHLARILEVDPTQLLFEPVPAQQLELPFAGNESSSRLEVECRADRLIVRPADSKQEAA